MRVEVWQSFSCNNSSSFYVVGRFESADAAAAVVATLDAQFEAASEDEDGPPWPADEVPSVWFEGNTVVVFHGYCGGLYDIDLPGAERGGDEGTPEIGVFLRLPDGSAGERLRGQLERFFAQADETSDTSEWVAPPWSNDRMPYADAVDDVVFWTDGRWAGFSTRWQSDTDGIKRYLGREGVTDFELLLCDDAFKDKLKVLVSSTRCPECRKPGLSFSPAAPGDDGPPQDQLLCAGCGGMFGLDAMALHAPVQTLGDQAFCAARRFGDASYAITRRGRVYRHRDGWELRADGGNALSGLLVVAAHDLIVVGDRGFASRSRDGGASFTRLETSTSSKLSGIARTPSGVLWACGQRGALIRSDDDGETWQSVKATRFDILDIACPSDEVLFACGRFGKILRSGDGGASWTATQTPVETPLRRLLARSEDDVIAVGGAGIVLRSRDGIAWHLGRGCDRSGDIGDIAAGDGALVCVNSLGHVMASTDDGETWSRRGKALPHALHAVVPSAANEFLAFGAHGLVARIERDSNE